MRNLAAVCLALFGLVPAALAQNAEDYASWTVLRSTFASTGGGGVIIKGYDPVIVGEKCMTTFMAVEPGTPPTVYTMMVEFEAVAAQGGTLCRNGKWKSFDGQSTGTTGFRVFFKDGVFRGHPLEKE
jgi:hypothetical protein